MCVLFTRCDVFCDLLQYTHTEKCCLFVLYNKNQMVLYNKKSNGLLNDFWGMKKEKQVCWRNLTWIWRHLCVSFNWSRSTTNENAHRSHVIVYIYIYLFVLFTLCCHLWLQYTHTEKCYIFVKYIYSIPYLFSKIIYYLINS